MELSTQQVDEQVALLQAQKSALTVDLESAQQTVEGLMYEKDELRSAAIRHGDASAKIKLDKLRQGIAIAQLSITDIGDEIAEVDGEIADLQAARIEAAKQEAWNDLMELSETVLLESAALDDVLAKFFTSLEPHAATLSKMNSLMARAGAHEKGFSLELFHRCVAEKFRTGFGQFFGRQGRIFHRGSIFEQRYADIIEQRVKGIKARHAGEPVAEDQELAVNE